MGILSALAPARARGQVVQGVKEGAFVGPEDGALGATVSLFTDAGIGTFVKNDYSDDPYLATWIRVLPAYGLSRNVSIQADAKLVHEYTAPSDAGAGPAGDHTTWDDIFLRLVDSSLYRDERFTGVNLSGAFSAALPVSEDSRWRDTRTKLTGTVALDRTFLDRLILVYTFAITKYVTKSSTPGCTAAYDESGILLRDCAGTTGPGYDRINFIVACSDTADSCGGTNGSLNTSYALKNRLAVRVRLTDKLSAGVALAFTTYLLPRVGGGVDTRHSRTLMLRDIRLGYRFTRQVSLVAGVATEQFFDLGTSREKPSVLYLGVSATW